MRRIEACRQDSCLARDGPGLSRQGRREAGCKLKEASHGMSLEARRKRMRGGGAARKIKGEGGMFTPEPPAMTGS
eukprot:244841-Hanusia_phi.AAC.1